MKQKYNIIFLAVLSAVVSCVQVDEAVLGGDQEQREMVTMSVSATLEKGTDTKTTLEGSLSDAVMHTLWEPSDKIALVAARPAMSMDEPVVEFVTDITENAEVADFEGTIAFASEYHAFYPYSSTLKDSCGVFIFNLPQEQKYVANSFDPSAAPMVAKAAYGENLDFKHLCGFLAIQIKGEESVKSITFIGKDEFGAMVPVSGQFEANMYYEDEPSIVSRSNLRSVTLKCDTPVALSQDTATPFYFVLPPATYSSFFVMIQTSDGKVMLREGTNPLTVSRSYMKPTAALKYAESIYIDLSEIGWSNCYIVPQAGMYSFDATVIGNGEYGLVPEVKFHTDNVKIDPKSVELLWQDKDNMITSLTLDNGEVKFFSTGVEGNAVVAVKDDSGKILWSWHIWSTDQPEEHVYVNDRGTFTMLDRNIGATRNDRGTGEEWRESQGMRYQWGRKDPFGRTVGSCNNLYNRINSQLSLAESTQYPNSYVQSSPWTTEMDYNLWSVNQKTIYDPCPVGYRVPPMDVWRGFTKDGENADRRSEMNVSGSFDYGWNFIYDGTNTAWYPTSYHISTWGDFYESEYEGHYWSVGDQETYWKNYFRFYYDRHADNSDFNCSIEFNQTHEVSNALAVRCMKDEGHVDISYPTVKITSIKDITSVGASVLAKVSDEGVSAVTERGIIWGTSEDINLENAESKKADSAGFGEFTIYLDGLAHSTTYYVKAYATNERGTSYSEARSFYTPYEGDAVNLSRNGTANCYIVQPVYSDYVFNASVKGNSNESVGEIASVEVLWETRNDRNPINVGDVIESVSLEGNNIFFRLPYEPKPGNALIAVKDAMGTILWSWHIWVVEFDPVATQQRYISGATMMDRNLGALNVISGDVASYGLFYQWGRKDPFVGSGVTWNDGWMRAYTAPSDAISYVYYDASADTIEHAVKNPTIVYDDASWNGASDLWGIKKTKYDPCPVGWRVSEYNAWEGLALSDVSSGLVIDEPYSVPAAYIPGAGRSEGGEYIYSIGDCAFIWLTERQSYLEIGRFYISSNSWGGVDHLRSVRCMKDIGTNKPGSGDDYIVDDEYEW